MLSTHELVNDKVCTYMPVLIKISLVTNPDLFTLTLMLRAGLDLMIFNAKCLLIDFRGKPINT